MQQIRILALIGVIAGLIGFVISQVVIVKGVSSNIQSPEQSLGTESPQSPRASIGLGNWVSRALTVAEQSADADLIVHVVALDSKVRKLENVLPTYAEDDKTVIGKTVDTVPFTDTRMRVLEVFKGTAAPEIVVMQTGGNLPASEGGSGRHFVMQGDPIYTRGTEHILFLKQVRDRIHAKNRILYVTANPAGRYLIEGQNVKTFAESDGLAVLPKTVSNLIKQIKHSTSSK